jgi:hypothetical protein
MKEKRMLSFLKKWFDPKEKQVRLIHKTLKGQHAEKAIADLNGEPWVGVLSTNVDAKNPKSGFFELDWNDKFVDMLRNAGYSGKNAEEVVDNWFNDLCKNVAASVDEESKFVADADRLARPLEQTGK